ncbi:uncharacterized protein LOC130894544 [Diorhabda carinulata]|uniref:uncharacterized protein LOC130894544 n=1 Tax=Diorhabda carinulata TaxID=1163345 RepID=UPI0025A095B9|nr:uncharacterized protein LOC130894544 [Diorhabda carinulata]
MATDGDSMDDDVFETLEDIDSRLNVSDRNFSQKGGTPSPTGYRNYKPPDEVLKLAENDVIESTEPAIHKTILLGDSGVGKTSLLVKFDTGKFQSGNFSATVGIGFTTKVVTVNNTKVKLQIWDTAGQERFRSVTHAYYRDAHALLLLYDVTNKTSFDNIRAWLGEIREYAQDDVVIMLLGNKADCGAERAVRREDGERLAREYSVAFMETSAKSGQNVELAFVAVARSDEPEERLVISRRIRNTFYVKYIPGDKCKFKEVAYHWGLAFANGSMKLYEEYHKKDYVFVVEPFTLTYHSQPYYLMFVVYEMYKNTKKIGELKAACSFEVSRENPIPIIKGGLEISVDSGKDIVIDGAGSIDLEVPHGQKGHLQFKWSCTVSDDKLSEFCQKNLGKNSMVKIPARYAVHNSIYTFTLSVKSRESDWQSTNQKVNIFTGASSIEIICEKNCPPDVPVSNAKQVTIFEVKCKVNCKNINSNLYKWSINSDFSYESATKFGRQGPVFYIYEKILTEGQTYEVSVEITNEQGKQETIQFLD